MCARLVTAWVLALVVLLMFVPAGRALAQAGTTHVVQPGETLDLIAATYGTTAGAIVRQNGLASADFVRVGQTLIIPAEGAQTGVSQNGGVHVVKVGDTISGIALMYGVSVSELARVNGITDPDALRAGQELTIPAAGSDSGAAVEPFVGPVRPSTTGNEYIVRAGDTLGSISQAFGVSEQALVQANGLVNRHLLSVGQVLTIPKSSSLEIPNDPATEPEARTDRYVVRAGDTLGSIAQSLGVSEAALIQANGIANPHMLSLGLELVVPDAMATGASPEVAVTGGGGEHTVQAGDTLSSIAALHGISMEALAQANSLYQPYLLQLGQSLVIPDGSETGTGGAAEAALSGGGTYTVQPGDTLGSIAARFGTMAAVIASANQLSSPDMISVGMELKIPDKGWTLPSATGKPSGFVASISQQRCWLYEGDQIIADWPCSSGQPGSETRPGSYTVQSKLDKAWGGTWGIWMPYWLGIYWAGGSENGIHGIPYDASGTWSLWDGYVGTPVTYGCILLDDEHASTLYDLAYVGMPVVIQP